MNNANATKQITTPNYTALLLNEQLQNVAIDAIEDGLEVYILPPTASSPALGNYFYVSDGTRIGRCEYSRTHGIIFTTVHVPSTSNGTGAQVSEGWDYFPGIIREVRASLAYVPKWWNHGKVEKYVNFDHYNEARHKGRLIKVTIA